MRIDDKVRPDVVESVQLEQSAKLRFRKLVKM